MYATTLWIVNWNISILWKLVNRNFQKERIKEVGCLLHLRVLRINLWKVWRLPLESEYNWAGHTVNTVLYAINATLSRSLLRSGLVAVDLMLFPLAWTTARPSLVWAGVNSLPEVTFCRAPESVLGRSPWRRLSIPVSSQFLFPIYCTLKN